VKPVNCNEFRARVNSLLKKKAYYDQLRANFDAAVQSAITDRLTGTYNKGYFQHYLKNELMRAERHAYPVAMLNAIYANGKNKVSGACSEGGREERCV
jgi:PleD family two-component response regulator